MSLVLNLRPTIQLTDAQFEQICRSNPELRLERTATGQLVAMSPTGSESGKKSLSLSGQLWLWNRQFQLGVAFDSSTGFTLPNGAIRSPDAAWIQRDRWTTIPLEQKRKFAPICPDFVAELRSPTDELADLQNKLNEYLENGAHLGWLIDPERCVVEVYRSNQVVEVLQSPQTLSGDLVLPNFTLDLQDIWQDS